MDRTSISNTGKAVSGQKDGSLKHGDAGHNNHRDRADRNLFLGKEGSSSSLPKTDKQPSVDALGPVLKDLDLKSAEPTKSVSLGTRDVLPKSEELDKAILPLLPYYFFMQDRESVSYY